MHDRTCLIVNRMKSIKRYTETTRTIFAIFFIYFGIVYVLAIPVPTFIPLLNSRNPHVLLPKHFIHKTVGLVLLLRIGESRVGSTVGRFALAG
jgi:hypothetical protein